MKKNHLMWIYFKWLCYFKIKLEFMNNFLHILIVYILHNKCKNVCLYSFCLILEKIRLYNIKRLITRISYLRCPFALKNERPKNSLTWATIATTLMKLVLSSQKHIRTIRYRKEFLIFSHHTPLLIIEWLLLF